MIHTPAFQTFVTSPGFLNQLGLPRNARLEFFPLGQGEYNLNYWFPHPVTGRKLVLRINTGSQMHLDHQITYEFSALKGLYPSGRVPEALFCDDSRSVLPYGVLVMEWLPGRPLRYETDLFTAAEIFADIHATPIPSDTMLIHDPHPAQGIYDECLQMVQHYFDWDRADKNICRLLEELIREIGRLPLKAPSSAPPCMVNTEVNSHNFLINDEGKSYLIDWEKPLISEPAQDLGHFLVPTTTYWKTDVILKPEDVAAVARHYVRAVNGRFDTASLTERLPLFFTVTCLRGVTWCAMALREYSQPDRPLTNQDTLLKIRQYINEDFLRFLLESYVRKDFLKGKL